MGEIWVPQSIAERRPLTRSISGYYLRHDVICLHTMVGSLWGSWDWSNRPGGTYWAFGTSGIGECVQCHDLQFRSAANLYGNPYVIPIENADMGPGFGSWNGQCGHVPPFTQAQIDRLIPLVAWLCRAFGIPPVLVPDTRLGRRGIAYHRQGIDPWRVPDGVLWSKSTGKCCPDDARIWQVVNVIIPGVVSLLGGTTPQPVPSPSPSLEDEMPYPVIACVMEPKSDWDTRKEWWALTPFGPYHVPGMEAYEVDVGNGSYKPMVRVNARQYDVALDQCRKRAKALADILAIVGRTEMRVIATGQILERVEAAVKQ